jgi:tetratricopeptide (TPR) repeat protein
MIEKAMRRVPAIAFVLAFAGMPALAADHWLRVSSPNFELYTTSSEKQGKDTVRHLEQVRAFFLQASPIRSLGEFPLRIFQFDTEAQYAPFRRTTSQIASFVATPASEYIVIGDRAAARQAAGDYAPSVHEYMHLVVRHSGLKLPTWLSEGWADVFSTLRVQGKDSAVGDLLPDRMKSLSADEWMDFDALTSVGTDSPAYNEASRVGIFYAESWALAHMLFLSPEYKDNFGKFVLALNSGKSSAEACQSAFGRSSAAVFADLRNYFKRKRLYGTVFETRLDVGENQITASPLSEFDASLGLADLMVAAGDRPAAQAAYARLEKEQPDRADLAQSIGRLALWSNDPATARRYFTKAFDAGAADAQMCYQLATLDRQAREPAAKVIPILERAIKSKPDFTEAKVELGLLRVDTRDFPQAVAELMSIPNITPQQATGVFCGLAYAYVQTGDLDAAHQNAESCRKWAKTDLDQRRAALILKFVEARSKPSADVRPNEKLRRVTGTARALDCSAEGNRLQIVTRDKTGDRIVLFDYPDSDAVEKPGAPRANLTLQCGALRAVPIGVEFAPPRTSLETSVGIVRRLDY